MTPEEIRGALIRTVPPLTVPPDRLAEVSRRVVRTRRRRVTLAVSAVVLATATATGTPALLSAAAPRSGTLIVPGNGIAPPSYLPSVHPFSGSPSDSSGPPLLGPLSSGTATSGSGPAAGLESCPHTVDLMSMSPGVVNGNGDATVALPLVQVTLCRYRHAAFDLSNGPATYLAGPATGKPGEFGTAVHDYADSHNPTRSPPSTGCLYPSPYRNVTVDLVFAADSAGTVRQYLLMRIGCSNDYVDPARSLEAAVDRVLGPPY